jgi:3-hydroxymyristoyl/3-hydroxydecanoyl-(acyl carrier protein) dehydratase
MTPLILHEAGEGDSRTLQLRVPVGLACFPGHFPGAPVLPGVVQVGWALRLAAARWGCPARCLAMEALKFQRLLQPGDQVTLTVRLDRARGKLHFAYDQGEVACSSGRLVLEPPA